MAPWKLASLNGERILHGGVGTVPTGSIPTGIVPTGTVPTGSIPVWHYPTCAIV